MVRVSNSIVVFVNTMLLLLGLISLFLGIYFVIVNNGSNSSSHCRKVLTNPLLILSGFLVTVSLLGLIGSLFKNSFFLFVYLGVMFLSILCLIGFTVFVFLITNNDAGKVFSEKEFFVKERKTGHFGLTQLGLLGLLQVLQKLLQHAEPTSSKTMDFSHWLQNHFVNDKNWNRIKSCLIDARVCTSGSNANGVNYKALVFFKKTFPAIQGGCCKPPSSCGFKPKNASFWEVPKSGAATSDPDCKTWSNNPRELCYDCNSCKSGILANLRKEWRSLAFINIILVVFLFFVYSIGCCARRSNHKTNMKYIRGFA
ncbi:tetraspanin-12 [Gossypium hirsutum]|uniref:Tetraspanin-12 n=1 Tax=Gossypium hirsutum TaxID=3635 RepID=A0ABM3C3W1_GOSHI|nr:tetraspanin-12-like [Gossypium hirsutum]